MESECNCPACLKTFSETNQLPCGHVFCPDCVAQTERRAQKTSQKPICPICLVPFPPAIEENPHPNSKYHDVLVSLLGPAEGKPLCKECENEAGFVCQDGCGMYCEECKADHLKPKKKTASHKFITLLESASSRKVNPRNCIIHNQQIIRLCLCCCPVAEMCSTCALEDAETNPGHSRIDVSKITYEAIKEDELIEKLRRKIADAREKKLEASAELARIAKQEEKELESINQFHDDIVQKAGNLKDTLAELTKSLFRFKLNKAETLLEQAEVTENVLKHSEQLLTESKEIYKKDAVITKLKRSAIISEIVTGIELGEIAPTGFDDIKSIVSLDRHEGNPSTCKKLTESLMDDLEKTQKAFSSLQAKFSNAPSAGQDAAYSDFVSRRCELNIKDYKFCESIGSNGSKPLEFNELWGMKTHPKSGNIYVVDPGNHRVQVLNEDFEFITIFGGQGSGQGKFNGPCDISISLNGLIAVCEIEGNRVQIFNETHSVVATIDKGQKKSEKCKQTSDYDGLPNPVSLCFDTEENLYVVNIGKARIDKFNSKFEFEFSFSGIYQLLEDLRVENIEISQEQSSTGNPGGFDETKIQIPASIFLTNKNELCVAVVRKSAGSNLLIGNTLIFYDTTGKYIRDFKVSDYKAPLVTANGPNNTIILSDPGNNTVRFCDLETGKTVHTLGSVRVGLEAMGKEQDEQEEEKERFDFNRPAGICFGLNQKLYICDSGNHRIQVFSAE